MCGAHVCWSKYTTHAQLQNSKKMLYKPVDLRLTFIKTWMDKPVFVKVKWYPSMNLLCFKGYLMLTSNYSVSRGMVASLHGCSVYMMVTELACSISPSLIQGCFHSLTGNLISFYPTKQAVYCKQVMVPKAAQAISFAPYPQLQGYSNLLGNRKDFFI